ncbi:NADH-quinone oxidoreductase subunit L [Roseomonas marmotae]|uniref:NADH-quinone oxidoreductase subunit L n=1 Tax=Roseomonas marmotae TaxID=2768161 RepID=A0ABS3K7V0_9PROT|nr:NADH-quinone oxidoreductase subunit L [Roseomonas marmotae]MBO1073537.1 NADH-quinone oxidoreductase subunit L [Roseomonas marmotae]QTI80276.1 NADH-quinone oxidoreductase subunit L [Roseomonas marmotae]
MYIGAIFFPLVGSIIAGLFGRLIGDKAAQWVTVFFMALAAICGLANFANVALGHAPTTIDLGTWIDVGGLQVSWALRYDTIAAVMVAMVTLISTMIHVYSVGYMSHDPTTPRFFSYLSLFTFMMLMLVTADNLAQLFFGWEGIGLASYLLIGYWYEKESANRAAMKAFIVNRVGDLFFMMGMALTFWTFGTIEFDGIFQGVEAAREQTIGGIPSLELIAFLLFGGAMGKSAQIGLHTWLPDAMEGPTPVSALIHAATLVTAGVFLMARMSPVIEYAPHALAFITFIGATTAFFAGTIGCVQNDIKRVIAYSTCSQLGYMFIAVGVGAYQGAIFHLFTHAFFKALLFLSAGSVIHAMSDEQDIRKMGGIWKKIPLTYAMFWIGSLALAGMPFFAGYYSKDFVLEAAFAGHGWTATYAFAMGMIAALLTAFYSWRLIILTFHGKPRADHYVMEHVHESPAVMMVPLLVLAAGALFAGALFAPYFVGHDWMAFWNGSIVNQPGNHIMHDVHEVPSWVPLAPTVVGLAGIAIGYVFYMFVPAIPVRLAATFPGLYRFLLNKWYFDELYDAIFVQPTRRLASWLWKVGDAKVIDGMPNGVAALTADAAGRVSRFQNGRVANYAFTMIIGLVLFVSIFLFGIGR